MEDGPHLLWESTLFSFGDPCGINYIRLSECGSVCSTGNSISKIKLGIKPFVYVGTHTHITSLPKS